VSNKLDDLNDKLNEFKSDYHTKEVEFKTNKNKLKEIEASIEAMKSQYEEAKQELGALRDANVACTDRDEELRKQYDSITNKEFEYRQEAARYKSELDETVRKIAEIKNVRQEKLNKLRQSNRDVYAAIDWLDKNKGRFREKFYEPLFLQVGIHQLNTL
jgi:chromosome segregation ATPase